MHDSDLTASPPPPNPMLPTLIGTAASVLVLVGVSALALQHLAARPLDLRQPTLRAANVIETGLLSNRVPESNIQAQAELRASDAAEFHYLDYDVTVPSSIDPVRLQDVLRRQLQSLGVSADAMNGGRGEPMLELTLADQPFGYVRLKPERERGWMPWPSLHQPESEGPAPETPPVPAPGAAEASTPSTPDTDGAPSAEPAIEEPQASASARAAPANEWKEHLEKSGLDATKKSSKTDELDAVQSEWAPPVQTAALPKTDPVRDEKRMRVAIILDDGGYGGEVTERVLKLDPRLTLSILPYTPYATETARQAQELGFEVMLHMPMENLDPELQHEGQLEIGMSPVTIEVLTARALEQVPGAVGVNNHMGSKFTADALSMRHFIDAIENESLYFIDSRTTAESQAYHTAFEAGIPVAYRNVFLDHVNDTGAIEEQFGELMTMAEENGSAIAIAHFRPNTVDVLERLLPRLEEAGIELVHASELLP